ncbi:hypothetical protein GCM10027271_09900 [Saccharopolyspora gloriosae]
MRKPPLPPSGTAPRSGTPSVDTGPGESTACTDAASGTLERIDRVRRTVVGHHPDPPRRPALGPEARFPLGSSAVREPVNDEHDLDD